MPRPPTGLPKGRPPTPTALRILRGTDKVHPERARGPEVVTGEAAVEPPAGLSQPAAEVWRAVIEPMIRANQIRSSDVETARAFCDATVLLRVCTIKTMREESGQVEPADHRQPSIYSWSRALAGFNSLGGRLGLSPVDRARLTVPEPEEHDDLIQPIWK